MIELVEAAAQGSLEGDTLMKSIEVNENLIKVLAVCSGEAKADFPIAPAAAAAKSDTTSLDFNDLMLEDSSQNQRTSSSGGPLKSNKSDYDDLFGSSPPIDPLNAAIEKPSSVPVKSNDEFDEFDAFLNDRTSSSKQDDPFSS